MGKFYFAPVAQLPKERKPSHERFHTRHSSGWIDLRLETAADESLGVIPGSGSIVLYEQVEHGTVEACVAHNGQPVIPGTGIKGSIRTLYEILTGSCDPTNSSSRCFTRRPNDPVCPACSLFGHLGGAGRIAFNDAVAESEGAVRKRITEVPVAWTPRRPGQFTRLYDGKEALDPNGQEPRDLVKTELYQGRFLCKMRFRNISDEEFGRLFLVLGLGKGKLTFRPKLGGKKFDGQGATRFAVIRASIMSPEKLGARSVISETGIENFVASRIEAARRDKRWNWENVEQQIARLATQFEEGY